MRSGYRVRGQHGRRCGPVETVYSSAWPSVALVPENEQEQNFLAESTRIHAEPHGIGGVQYDVEPSRELFIGLSDRVEGLELLAEALAQGAAVGTYRDFIRLFENAFGFGSSAQLEKKLTQFLESGQCDYTRDEVREWFAARDGASHADKSKATDVVLSSDVSRFIPRMEHAALDVLYNKAEWGTRSKERRKLVAGLGGTEKDGTTLRMVAGREANLTFRVLDPFQAYPLDFQATLKSPPAEWWYEAKDAPVAQSGGEAVPSK